MLNPIFFSFSGVAQNETRLIFQVSSNFEKSQVFLFFSRFGKTHIGKTRMQIPFLKNMKFKNGIVVSFSKTSKTKNENLEKNKNEKKIGLKYKTLTCGQGG